MMHIVQRRLDLGCLGDFEGYRLPRICLGQNAFQLFLDFRDTSFAQSVPKAVGPAESKLGSDVLRKIGLLSEVSGRLG